MAFQESEYHPYDFANRRHIGPSPSEMAEMLEVVGAASVDALIEETVPAGIRQAEPLSFGPALSEQAALYRLRRTARKNRVLTSLIGQAPRRRKERLRRSRRLLASDTSSDRRPG